MATSSLGPILTATVVTPNLNPTVRAWREHLHQRFHAAGHISLRQARYWGLSSLTRAPVVWLANELEERWLRIIEIPDAKVAEPFSHRGWISLEINVQDVNALRAALEKSPFQVIGEPAGADIGDDTRTLQVIGPAGEVLRLNQVKTEANPFDLPAARCAVDRPVASITLADDRDNALEFYKNFPDTEGLKSDVRIPVINQARQLDFEQKHPVATIKLRGDNLIEINQLDGLEDRPVSTAGLPAGIAMVSFAVKSVPDSLAGARRGSLLRGAAGELIELIED